MREKYKKIQGDIDERMHNTAIISRTQYNSK